VGARGLSESAPPGSRHAQSARCQCSYRRPRATQAALTPGRCGTRAARRRLGRPPPAARRRSSCAAWRPQAPARLRPRRRRRRRPRPRPRPRRPSAPARPPRPPLRPRLWRSLAPRCAWRPAAARPRLAAPRRPSTRSRAKSRACTDRWRRRRPRPRRSSRSVACGWRPASCRTRSRPRRPARQRRSRRRCLPRPLSSCLAVLRPRMRATSAKRVRGCERLQAAPRRCPCSALPPHCSHAALQPLHQLLAPSRAFTCTHSVSRTVSPAPLSIPDYRLFRGHDRVRSRSHSMQGVCRETGTRAAWCVHTAARGLPVRGAQGTRLLSHASYTRLLRNSPQGLNPLWKAFYHK
jgi:hypothetical protein